jgi:hypothetical protein
VAKRQTRQEFTASSQTMQGILDECVLKYLLIATIKENTTKRTLTKTEKLSKNGELPTRAWTRHVNIFKPKHGKSS